MVRFGFLLRLFVIRCPRRFGAQIVGKQSEQQDSGQEQLFHAQTSINAARGASVLQLWANTPEAGIPAQSLFQSRAVTRVRVAIRRLTNVARDEFRHLEHADLALAVENRSKVIVGVDLRSFCFVLKTVLLDVVPELFGELRTRYRFRTHDSRELVVRLDWSHEGGIGFAF
jgi:hypothetical protein